MKSMVVCLVFVFSIFGTVNYAHGSKEMNYIYEVVTWKAKEGVSDSDMITAVDLMVVDLQRLDGFLNQTLYKDKNGQWVDVYYWKTEKNAIDSNDAMADKESFKSLIGLIEPDSVSIEILEPLQTSGDFKNQALN